MADQSWTSVSAYLDFLEVSSVVRKRVDEIASFYQAALPGQEPHTVYISEFVDPEGQRTLENIWFFFSNTWAEAHNFMIIDKFDVCSLDIIKFIDSQRQEYIPGSATQKSRFTVDFTFDNNITGNFKASGSNCERLFQIYRDILIPATQANR